MSQWKDEKLRGSTMGLSICQERKSHQPKLIYFDVLQLACTHMRRSEDNFQESVLSFHSVGPRDWTWVVRLGGKHLDPLNHFNSPLENITLGAGEMARQVRALAAIPEDLEDSQHHNGSQLCVNSSFKESSNAFFCLPQIPGMQVEDMHAGKTLRHKK